MNKIKKILKKQWFTLVELIIVIAIIAVLAVAAFMMLTKWLGQSRDSRRLWDLATIQKWLEVWYTDMNMGNGLYPDISTQDGVFLLYSGDDTSKLAYQWVVDLEVAKLANLQKLPLDPSDNNEYIYFVTANRKKFQIMGMLENGNEATVFVDSVFALDYSNRIPTSKGYELGILLEKGTNLPIQYATNLTGLDLTDPIVEYVAYQNDGETILSGSAILANLQIEIGDTTIIPTIASNCTFDWNTIIHNTSVTAYEADTVLFWNTCNSEERSCNDGNLDWTFSFTLCTVEWASWTFTLSQTTVNQWTPVNLSDNCSTTPTWYTSSDTSVATVSWNTITTIWVWTTNITPEWWACADNIAKTLTVNWNNCLAWTKVWTTYWSVTYNYNALLNWNTSWATWSLVISHWTKDYTATVMCNNWIISISSEIETVNCDSIYANNSWTCELWVVIFDTINSSPNITFSTDKMVATWYSPSATYRSGFISSNIWVVEIEVVAWTTAYTSVWVTGWDWDPDVSIGTSLSLNQIMLRSTGEIRERIGASPDILVAIWGPWTFVFWDKIGVKYDSTTVYFYINGELKNTIAHWYLLIIIQNAPLIIIM